MVITPINGLLNENRWEYILFIPLISLILPHSNPKLRLLDAEIYLLLLCRSVYPNSRHIELMEAFSFILYEKTTNFYAEG